MEPRLSHIQFNVQPGHLPFYRDLLQFLGWQTLYDAEDMLGVLGTGGTSLWFAGQVKAVTYDYDGPGMNHVALGVATQADVDAAAKHLTERGVELLFETPRHREEFSQGPEHTYYQIMFETPDRILVEIVYTGPKSG